MASQCSPDRLGVILAGVVLDLVGELGDQLGSLCPVGIPEGDGHEALVECQRARAADLGWYA